MNKKFNLLFLETIRLKLKSVPRAVRSPIILLVTVGIPIALVIAVYQSMYTWWSILLFIIYFGVSGLSFVDWLVGRRNRCKTKIG